MQIVLEASKSFEKLAPSEKEQLTKDLQEELKTRSEMIEGFKQPVEDFEEWEELGFESEGWN